MRALRVLWDEMRERNKLVLKEILEEGAAAIAETGTN